MKYPIYYLDVTENGYTFREKKHWWSCKKVIQNFSETELEDCLEVFQTLCHKNR